MGKSKELTIDEIQMRNKPFYLIDKNEILNGIRLSGKNAKSLYDAALNVKETSRNFGLANSLLILAGEESIKSFVLMAVLVNIQLPFSIDLIFSMHTVKHARGKELNRAIQMTFLFLQMFPLVKNPTNDSFKRAVNGIMDISSKEEWWESANLSKNRGLYVDYLDNHFITPLEFDEKVYKTSEQVVSNYVKLMAVISELKQEYFQEVIDLMRDLRDKDE